MTREGEFRRVFKPGAQIFREGEPGDCAYVIERGRVEISALRDGKKVRLATLVSPEVFGEMALVDNEMRSASATAIEETEVVIISRDRVESEMESADPLVQLLLRVVLDRLRHTSQRMVRYKTGPSDESSVDMFLGSKERDLAYRRAHRQAIGRLKREQELRIGLENQQFLMHFQPIVRLVDGSHAGSEALIRWNHPTDGLVYPGEFIGLAEETRLIVPMGLWALEESCSAIEKLVSQQDQEQPFLSVNVSAVQIVDGELERRLPEILERTGLEPEYLDLEITETVLLDDPDSAVAALKHFKSMGVFVTLDDFGTGYSSLSYLHRFPIDRIKIDRSFVTTMHEHRVSRLIVRAVINLADALELQVVAEGVETEEQRRDLVELGCELGQGYLFARPGPFRVGS